MSKHTPLDADFKTAYRFTRVGYILLSVITAVSLFIFVTYLCGYMVIGITDETPLSYWLISFIATSANFSSYFLLARFMRCFTTEESSFGKSQEYMLLASGSLFLLNWILSYAPGPSRDILIVSNPIPIALSQAHQPSLGKLAIAIFIICTAGTLGYAAALKEDSDSIL